MAFFHTDPRPTAPPVFPIPITEKTVSTQQNREAVAMSWAHWLAYTEQLASWETRRADTAEEALQLLHNNHKTSVSRTILLLSGVVAIGSGLAIYGAMATLTLQAHWALPLGLGILGGFITFLICGSLLVKLMSPQTT